MANLLSSTFLSSFPNDPPAWKSNTFGHFVYKRTYSRWLPEANRRETWKETVSRVVEYSMSLYQGPASVDDLRKEAETMFSFIFNLQVFPAGRTLWVGGTDAVQKHPFANFNCSFRVIDGFEAFTDIFYLLMLGVGTGFRVTRTDAEKLPVINPDIALAHKPYHGKKKSERIEDTMTFQEDDSFYIVVGDSKEGWVEALRQYLKALATDGIESIVINYDSVRPAGEILKTFGGRASGHTALRDMFKKLHKVVRNGNTHLQPVQLMDMCNIIAQAVVVGGVRRSSQITLFDMADTDILDAKLDLYTDPAKAGKDYRSQSNNSIFFNEKPSRSQLEGIFQRILTSYEPGFINAEAARNRRPWYQGTNPLMA